MQNRKLEDLNLLDDFLFNKIVSHSEYGQQFSRELLRIVLGKNVGKLQVIPQKVYYGSDPRFHGARLENAKSDWLKMVHQMVREVKRDEEV